MAKKFLIVTCMFLAWFEVLPTSLPQDICHDSEVSQYCPSTCAVEKELFLFKRNIEKSVAKQREEVERIRESLNEVNYSYQIAKESLLNGFPADEDFLIIESEVEELEKNTTVQKEDWIRLLLEMEKQETVINGLFRELTTLEHECSQICGKPQDHHRRHALNGDSPSSTDCVNDLCRRAATGQVASVTQEAVSGEVCPEFTTPEATDCAALYESGYRKSGIYRVTTHLRITPIRVFCDMQDAGGGWTVIQRRLDGSLNFNRTWKEYEQGFGNISCGQEFWLGNKNLASFGHAGFQSARIVMNDWNGESRVAQYAYFKVNEAHHRYTLQISAFEESESNVSDAMIDQNNMRFTTSDQRNIDSRHLEDCERLSGGWWLNDCHHANLNGHYHQGEFNSSSQPNGIIWSVWKGNAYSLRSTEIKLRPYGFSGT